MAEPRNDHSDLKTALTFILVLGIGLIVALAVLGWTPWEGEGEDARDTPVQVPATQPALTTTPPSTSPSPAITSAPLTTTPMAATATPVR
jgi:hypothetical protein